MIFKQNNNAYKKTKKPDRTNQSFIITQLLKGSKIKIKIHKKNQI